MCWEGRVVEVSMSEQEMRGLADRFGAVRLSHLGVLGLDRALRDRRLRRHEGRGRGHGEGEDNRLHFELRSREQRVVSTR